MGMGSSNCTGYEIFSSRRSTGFNHPTTWAQIHKHYEIILPYVESRLIFHIRFQIAEESPIQGKMAGTIDLIVGCN